MDRKVSLKQLQEFSKLITAFGKVERVYYVPGTERKENDHEHSYMLAMVAWYLVCANKLRFNQEKIFKYALAHDIVEVYAGDVWVFSTDKEQIDGKGKRELEAAERLREEFKEFDEMYEYMVGYMKREDDESKFVYALDKVLPLLLIEADGGRSWKEKGVKLEMLINNKSPKVAVSSEIEEYFNELIALLKKDEQQLFSS